MSDPNSPPIEVSVKDVSNMQLSGAEFLLLDCRETDEHQTANISGATLIPMNEIPDRLPELEPHRERPIVVHCHHGGRSMRVTQWLREQGFAHVQNMAGGIDAWSQEIDPSIPRY